MEVRAYSPADRAGCVAVFNSSGCDDRVGLERFLDGPVGAYFVMEHEGSVVGCGGFEVTESTASLVWGMVRRDMQRKGLGRLLLMYRLREIGKRGGVQQVRVEVKRDVAGFYEGQGFKVARVVGERVELVKKMAVCA